MRTRENLNDMIYNIIGADIAVQKAIGLGCWKVSPPSGSFFNNQLIIKNLNSKICFVRHETRRRLFIFCPLTLN